MNDFTKLLRNPPLLAHDLPAISKDLKEFVTQPIKKTPVCVTDGFYDIIFIQ
ncbi:hypothetical protein GQ473_02545 [archaeon]|nr:hypothetical protein [archaeon]